MSYHFQSDITSEKRFACFEVLELNAPRKKLNEEYYWPLFKKWFTDSISALVPEYDFAALMAMVAVENPQPYIGSVFIHGITLYFHSNITSCFRSIDGCNRYAAMNKELSGINGFTEVVLITELFENVNRYSWRELIDQIEIISYYCPKIAELAGVICCTKIPRNQLADFLRFANYYTPIEGNANLRSASANDIRMAYKKFVKQNNKNLKNRRAGDAEKKKEKRNGGHHKAKENYRNKKIVTCNKCNKRGHFAKECWSAEINCIV